MRLAISIAALLILFAGAASAATVVLENGDQVSGDILRTEGKLLVIRNELIGVVRVPLSAVTSIETDGVFTVVLASGDRVTGEVKTDGKGNLKITNDAGTVSAPLADVHGMLPAPRDLAYPEIPVQAPDAVDTAIDEVVEPLWEGQAELGFNWQTGNTERLGLVFGLTLDRETDYTRTGLRLGIIYTEDDKVRSANRQILAVQHDIKFSPKWYFFGLAVLSRDEFKDINFRGAMTPGIGYIVNDDDAWKLRAEAGPTLTYTSWDNADNEWTFELFVAVKAEVQVFDEARLIQNIFWYPSITNSPDGRIVSETVLEQPLSESLFLRISFLVNYDTTVVAPTKETDTNLLVTLAIKF